MSDELKFPAETTKTSEQSRFILDFPGQLSQYLGSGRHAQTAIVYLTIKWSFVVGVGFSLLVFIGAWLGWNTFTVDDLTSVWTIFVPLITLALGYLFGKGRE